eukprot:m.105016 g.105016  ORF g.105016 m.105016 type:complete len:332 (+) comp27613_c0_seq1:249-1244(+)
MLFVKPATGIIMTLVIIAAPMVVSMTEGDDFSFVAIVDRLYPQGTTVGRSAFKKVCTDGDPPSWEVSRQKHGLIRMVAPHNLVGFQNNDGPAFIFIHVGKCGGGSIENGLVELARQGYSQGTFQIHTSRRGRLCEGRGSPGPVSAAARITPEVLRTANVFAATVLWVRDPVSRIVSIWNNKGKFTDVDKYGNSFLAWANTDVELSEIESDSSFGHFKAELQRGHAWTSLDWYVDDLDVLDSLPPLFVGRVEHMAEDWTGFQKRFWPEQVRTVPLVHEHASEKQGKQLPSRAVDFLKSWFKNDFSVMLGLVKRGLLSPTYVATITNRTVYMY